MSILDIMVHRRSIRQFTGMPVPEEAVRALIEAVRWAPSAGNLQSRKFLFVFDGTKRKELARAALGQDFIAQAPLAVVACLDRRIAVRYGDRGVNLYSIQDVAAAVMNLMLMAQEIGLGTCWVGAFNEYDVAELLDLPDHLRPVAIVPVGWPAWVPFGAPKRLPQEEAVTLIR